MYNVIFYTYSGMSIPLEENLSKDEAKDYIAARIKRARNRGQVVDRIGKGKWEFQTSDDAFAISDSDGFLFVRGRQ